MMNSQPDGNFVDRSTPHPCLKCSYELGGLKIDSPCPECGKPVAESLPVELLKQQSKALLVEDVRPCLCYKCAYDLRGLRMHASCPECGTPVAESLRGVLLHFADRNYIARVKSGVSLILNSILLMVLVHVWSGVAAKSGSSVGISSGSSFFALQFVWLALTVMSCVGYYRFTATDTGFAGSDSPATARKFIRGVAILQVVLVLMANIAVYMPHSSRGTTDVITAILLFFAAGFALIVTWLVIWAFQAFAMMYYVRWMSRRIPDAYLVGWSTTYRWLLPLLSTVGILVIIGPLFAVVMYWNLLARLRKHLRSIHRTGVPAITKGTHPD